MSAPAVSDWSSCVPNIGPVGRRRRYLMAALCLGLGVGAASYLQVAAAPPAIRLLLAVPSFLASLYYFQAREKT
jgi:hypothetical protein